MIRSFLRLSLALLVVLGSSCASSGAGGDSAAVRVSLWGYEGSPSFELLSTSHTERVDLYSKERQNASVKVQKDEVMNALVERLYDLGYEKYARNGSAPDPEAGGAGIKRAFEVERNGVASWWALATNSSGEEKVAFSTAVSDFLDLFNVTLGLQNVENTEGGEYFDAYKRVRKD